MQEGGQEEEQVDAAVADDGPCKGHHYPYNKHPGEGKQEAKKAKRGKDGLFCQDGRFSVVTNCS